MFSITTTILYQTQRLNEVKKEEFELLEAQSIPLRNYLMKHVMPTLTQGLIECCKNRPEDAIDFLVRHSHYFSLLLLTDAFRLNQSAIGVL